MLFLKKFCCYFSLRTGSLCIAYFGLFKETLDIVFALVIDVKLCGGIFTLWCVSCFWNIISEFFIIVAVYRNNPSLLPVHMVTCLAGLIMEMVSYMLIASNGVRDFQMAVYSFFTISYMAADIIIILSYYHSEV